jgi:molecular chaperone DnaJ
MARAIRDYYRVLGVSPRAELAAIKRAYRELIEDIDDEEEALGTSGELEEARRDAHEAFAVLARRETRAAFDPARAHVGWWDTGGAELEEEDPRGIAAGEAIEAALRRILTNDDPAKSARIVEFTLPFELAALGGRARVRLPMRAACPECAGLGGAASNASLCTACGGSRDRRAGCETCQGRGWVVSIECARCGGDGWVPALGSADLVIPPGVSDGTLLPFPGFGESEETAGAPRIRVKVSSHPFFRRVGRDILCKVPVSRRLAERGSTIRVKTLRGENQTVIVPPHTADGTVLRLVGEGIHADGERGDQLIEIRVRTRRGRKTGGSE